MRRARTPPGLPTLALLSAFSALSLNMFLPSLAHIAEDLQADYALVSMAVSGYLAMTAVVLLIVGPISDRIGRRPVTLVALPTFTGASVMCALAEDVTVFLASRVFQGGMVTGFAMSLAIVSDTTPKRQAASLLGYISMTMALAPMLGPLLGGFLDSTFGWRSNFWTYAGGGVVLLVLCWFDLGETRGMSRGREAAGKGGFRDLIRERLFWAYSLSGVFSTGAFYVFLAGAPLVAKTSFGVESAELGIYIGSITAGFMAGAYLSGKFAARFRLSTMILTGRLITCTGLLVGIICFASGLISPLLYFGSTIFIGIGNGVTMPSANVGAMSVRPSLSGTASGMMGALTVAIGALMTGVTAWFVRPESAALTLLFVLLAVGLAGLTAALWTRRLEDPADIQVSDGA